MARFQLRNALILTLVFAACHAPGRDALDGGAESETLTVMSFNIRYGTAADGDHVWPARRDLVAQRVASVSPDVLAIQEGLDFQLVELADVLAGYIKLGQHRDGGTGGEFSGLYVRESTVDLLGWGEMWLSPRPEAVASRGWDAALPRMAVWADVQSRAGGRVLRVYGTHYDHRGAEARLASSHLILSDALNQPAVVVTGDFNATESSAPMQAFFNQGWQSAVRSLHPADPRGTFNGFRDPTGGRRIDHLMYRGVQPVTAEILGGRLGELFPSDHDAVVARFRVD
jgi:endonuclease/exonuclease/phosphatase family metal-dependent hydrolase